jgi:hypothetical protein
MVAYKCVSYESTVIFVFSITSPFTQQYLLHVVYNYKAISILQQCNMKQRQAVPTTAHGLAHHTKPAHHEQGTAP